MNKVCVLIILIFESSISLGQTKEIKAGGIEMQVSSVDTSLNTIFCKVGQEPKFPGGTKNLVAFAKRKIKYPQTAINDSVQGSVILLFTINKKGKVVDKKIVQSVRKDLDNVCLKMLNQMPLWRPARIDNKAIAAYERWKIIFILTD
ncbi:MAG: TonB family protein [Bacteroidetes bacterium]|nr:TonB family protein [Bacteroidota bacterium]